MKLNSYPSGDFGNISYRFSASFTHDDFQNMFILRENEGDRNALYTMLSRWVGIEYPVYRASGAPTPTSGTFLKHMFRPETNEERALLNRNEYQIEALLWRANHYASLFVQKFYGTEFLRDNRRNQTFTYPLSTNNPMEKVFSEVPYMPPVINDWHPQVQKEQQEQQVNYVPVEPYRPQV